MHSNEFQLNLNAQTEICLGGGISLSNVIPIYNQLIDLINRVDVIRINLHDVEYADSSSLALLLECIRCAKAQNKDIAFFGMPQLMQNLGRVYGLDAVLPINKSLFFKN